MGLVCSEIEIGEERRQEEHDKLGHDVHNCAQSGVADIKCAALSAIREGVVLEQQLRIATHQHTSQKPSLR